MDTWNSDQVLYVLQYLNVNDLNRVSSTARRYFYLVNEYRCLRGPELVTARSFRGDLGTQKTQEETLKESLEQLQSKPNLALCFSTSESDSLATYLEDSRRLIPLSTTFLEARSSDIQSAHQKKVEWDSRCLSLLAHFPNATIQGFHFDHDNDDTFLSRSSSDFSGYIESLQQQNVDWKAFIVYACGELGGLSQTLIADLQRAYPDAIIVGGFCNEGYVTDETSEGSTEIRYIEDGVFGVALGGDIPMKSVVSRGAKSLVQDEPRPTSPLKVQSATFHKNEGGSYHTLDRFIDESGRIMTFHEVLAKYSQPEFIGLRRQNEDGFHIADVHPLSHSRNMICIIKQSGDDEDSYLNADIDLYDLDGDACKSDVAVKMALLKEQTKDEQILGALMFTCSGRGPNPGFLIDKEMHDATCFSDAFPNVPCLGFYAGGEIGPEAVVARQDAFQRGNVKLQGFTAVFALFIVPKAGRWVRHDLDDAPERVQQFCAERLIASPTRMSAD
jgi:small ligand-binding sensory domain FIST